MDKRERVLCLNYLDTVEGRVVTIQKVNCYFPIDSLRWRLAVLEVAVRDKAVAVDGIVARHYPHVLVVLVRNLDTYWVV